MNEQTKLSTLKVKDTVKHYLLVVQSEVKSTKTGKNYLDMELRDDSTSMNAKMWDIQEPSAELLQSGDIVKVNGIVDEFNNQLQLKIENIRLAEISENVSPSDFLPKSKRDPKKMEEELYARIKSINNSLLKDLLRIILSGDNLEKFKKVPAGKAWHHAYIGGLLEHTLEIIKICDLMCDIHPEINRDLLITGAILHDFGKTEELNFSNDFNYTDKGKLIGHIVIASMKIENAAEKIENFPEELKNQLIHIVLSHQGKLEYASPVLPKTLEAIVLYHADELSAKTNAFKGAILNEMGKNTNWTKYLPLAETSLFIPDKNNSDNFKDTLF